MMKLTTNKRSALVWILSGFFLLFYGLLGLLEFTIPGLEELSSYIEEMTGMHLYTAAFLAIFFEGLYVVGSFIPGSTLVILLAILAQTGGIVTFLYTIFAIFIGWCVAGAINIFITSKLIAKTDVPSLAELAVHDRMLTTWYPAFCSNYEVAQVVAGISPLRVFWSSVRVKVLASLGAAAYACIVPLIIDVENLQNEDGFFTVLLIGVICVGVGVWGWRGK